MAFSRSENKGVLSTYAQDEIASARRTTRRRACKVASGPMEAKSMLMLHLVLGCTAITLGP